MQAKRNKLQVFKTKHQPAPPRPPICPLLPSVFLPTPILQQFLNKKKQTPKKPHKTPKEEKNKKCQKWKFLSKNEKKNTPSFQSNEQSTLLACCIGRHTTFFCRISILDLSCWLFASLTISNTTSPKYRYNRKKLYDRQIQHANKLLLLARFSEKIPNLLKIFLRVS